jgi:hypothetical protein
MITRFNERLQAAGHTTRSILAKGAIVFSPNFPG